MKFVRLCYVVLLSCFANSVFAQVAPNIDPLCSAVFPSGAASNDFGAGQIIFNNGSRILGSGDQIHFQADKIGNFNNVSNSCETMACGSAGFGAEPIVLPSFDTTTSNTNLTLFTIAGIFTFTLPTGDYNNVTVLANTNTSSRTEGGTYVARNLNLQDNATIRLKSGTYWFEFVSLGNNAKIEPFDEDSKILIYTRNFNSNSNISLNASGKPEQLSYIIYDSIQIGSNSQANGYFYSDRNFTFQGDTTLTGAITSKDAFLNQNTVITYDGAAIGQSAFGSSCMTPELIAYYQFEGKYEDIVFDSTGNGNNGTIKGLGSSIHVETDANLAPSCQVANFSNFGGFGESGFDTGLDINDLGDKGTISFWYKADNDWINDFDDKTLISASLKVPPAVSTANDRAFYFQIEDRKTQLNIGIGTRESGLEFLRTEGHQQPLANQEWVHIAMAWDYPNRVLKTFVNGQEITNTGLQGGSPLGRNLYELGNIIVGGNLSGVDSMLNSQSSANGDMDEVRIYNNVQSESEVQADMMAREECGIPQAYYEFEQTSFASGVANDIASKPFGEVINGVTPETPPTNVSCIAAKVEANFDDSVDAIDTKINLGNEGTISFWYLANEDWDSGTPRQLFDASEDSQGNFNNKTFFLTIEPTGKLQFSLEDVFDRDVSVVSKNAHTFKAGEWVHINVSWNLAESEYLIYLNSSLIEVQTVAAEMDQLANVSTLHIGDNVTNYVFPARTVNGVQFAAGTTNSADGYFDSVRVYEYVRRPGEVRFDMEQVNACNKSLLLHYDFAPDPDAEPDDPVIFKNLANDGSNYNGVPWSGESSIITPLQNVGCQALYVPNNVTRDERDGVNTGLDMNTVGEIGTIQFYFRSDINWGDKVNNQNINRKLFDAAYLDPAAPDDYFNNFFFLEMLSDGKLSFAMDNAAENNMKITTDQALTFTSEDWVHVTVQWDMPAKFWAIYVNGEPITSTVEFDDEGNFVGQFGQLGELSIGDSATDYSFGVSRDNSAFGSFDEFKVYSFLLMTDEIKASFEQTPTPCAAFDRVRINYNESNLSCDAAPLEIWACSHGDANDDNENCEQRYTDEAVTLSFILSDGTNPIVNFEDVMLNNGTKKTDIDFEYESSPVFSGLDIDAPGDFGFECYASGQKDDDCTAIFSDAGFQFFSQLVDDKFVGGTSEIPTQIGQQTFINANLRAVRKDEGTGACEALLTGQKDISLTYDYSCSASNPDCASQLSINNTNFAKGVAHTVPLTFNSSGVADLTLNGNRFNFPDAGELTVTANRTTFPLGNSGEDGTGEIVELPTSTAIIDVVPDTFAINEHLDRKRAGEDVELSISAVGKADSGLEEDRIVLPNYQPKSGSLRLRVVRQDPALGVGQNGDFTITDGTSVLSNTTQTSDGHVVNLTFVKGVYSSTDTWYSEFGEIELALKDTDYLRTNEITMTDGKFASFIPAYFDVTVNDHDIDSTCGNFSYLGFPFSLTTAPVLTFTAYNERDGITQNYSGAHWTWVPDVSVFNNAIQIADGNYSPMDASGMVTPSIQILDTANVAVSVDTTIRDSFDGNNAFTLQNLRRGRHIKHTPIVPFQSDIALTYTALLLTDTTYGVNSDERICYMPLDDNNNRTTNCQPLVLNSDNQPGMDPGEMRWGRLVLENASGPEGEPLLTNVYTEYVNASEVFERNRDDSCTVLNWSSTSAPSQLNLAAPNDPTDTSFASEIDSAATTDDMGGTEITLAGGKNPAATGQGISVAAPNEMGQVRMTLQNTNSMNFDNWNDYLWYDWSGGNAVGVDAAPPSAILTFGRFRGNDRIIHWREDF